MTFIPFARLSLLVAAALTVVSSVHATESMRIPANKNETMRVEAQQENPSVHQVAKRTMLGRQDAGLVNFAYYVNWAIYAGLGNFMPTDIVPDHLTHILYSFADIDPATGHLTLSDEWADEQITFDGDDTTEAGTNLYGCLKQMYKMKLAKRSLKVLLSVGGYTWSQEGHFGFVTNDAARAQFVTDAVQLIEDYGFDGIDLDFEFPANADEGTGYGKLFTELRAAFDTLQTTKGDAEPYQLTVAVSSGAANYANLDVPTMDAALSYWNLMAYDYSGAWLDFVANQANVIPDGVNNVSTKQALDWYAGAGATTNKMVLGIPIYGRGFEETDGLGATYNGVGAGTTDPGVWAYKNLPFAGAEVFENTTSISSYSYDSAKREWISYDTPAISAAKGQYAADNGLAGTMFWELSTDKVGEDSLVTAAAGKLGTLDATENHINFPNSKWDNIKNNLGQSTTRRSHMRRTRAVSL
ncbi:glycoside hydrolase family 18 protein [Schizophyllum amplum]|uniref:Glycoside hydrolase family 18 protein n=1 Tax=Schizophyllum amplum TaxID=97359 RepID=A0A550C860_9AGAR|nr:glycoside hydrolase family 18 protein [Auriculariopsis ampla]